jgi:WD40 repeat protein
MSTPTERAEAPRLPTIATWWLWIVASAAIPIMGVLRDVLLQRTFGPHFDGQQALIIPLALLLTAAPAIIQGAVLRRLAPQLSLGIWVMACWVSAVLAFFALDELRRGGFDAERAFDLARLRPSYGGGSLAWTLLWVTANAAAVALLYNLVPTVVLGWMAKRSAVAFLLYIVLGACVAVALHKLYATFNPVAVKSLYGFVDLNRAQSSWSHIAQYAATVGLFGMVQGAVSGFGLMRMFAPSADASTQRPHRLGARVACQVFGLVAMVLVAGHAVRYAIGPFGITAGFPGIRKAFSFAPASDRSEGASVLSFSHKIDLPMPVWFATPSPDGRTVLLVTKDRSVRRLDVERRIVADAPLVAAGDSIRGMVFSPDGRYVAINQPGRRRDERGHHLGRIQLFVADGFVKIKDFWAEEPNCAFSSTMTFSEDSRAIWVVCERSPNNPRDLLAVTLRLPDPQIVERWPGPEITGRGSASFGEIVANDAGSFIAGYDWAGGSQYLSVLDVTKNVPLFDSRNAAVADLGGPGFGFCGLHLSRDARLVTLAHCALPAPQGDMYQTMGQFRTFDIGTRSLVADFGRQSPGQDVTQWSLAFDRGHGRFVGIGTTLGSKRGTLVLWDQATGAELQRIETGAYRAGKFSHDGRWLLVLGRDDDAIYFYRAAP